MYTYLKSMAEIHAACQCITVFNPRRILLLNENKSTSRPSFYYLYPVTRYHASYKNIRAFYVPDGSRLTVVGSKQM